MKTNNIYNYRRYGTRRVKVGNTAIGADEPIRLQSMTNTDTNDISGSCQQIKAIAAAGADLVRLTTQGKREAENLGLIREKLQQQGIDIPLVADVHFTPAAALTAARTAHKVRINPGNYADAARTFRRLQFSDSDYALELDKIHKAVRPLLEECKHYGTALRLGVNHGSLSDRIMSRYGDTSAGMTESVMEYLHICQQEDFHDIVISVKASNPVMMVQTVRMLAERMESEGMSYPLHIGVTEAGNGEDGRIKSAVGIGTLLAEGLGDTIRVSLSEAPENEIPVARALRDYITARAGHSPIPVPQGVIPVHERKGVVRVAGVDTDLHSDWVIVDAASDPGDVKHDTSVAVYSNHINPVGEMASFIDRLRQNGYTMPIMLLYQYGGRDIDVLTIHASADLGALLLNGYGDAIGIIAPEIADNDAMHSIALGILQATRLRITRTEYIACPSCGRTLFDLERTLADVRRATSHLSGLKIGVMGCIVNGPGEMADADYGYVGAGPGRVTLYRRKEAVLKNIPAEEALTALLELIRVNGDWREPVRHSQK